MSETDPEADAYEAPRPPSHLRRHGKALWRSVARDWEIEHDSDQLEVLTLAAEAADRAAQAREELRKVGSLTWTDRLGNIRPRPEVEIEAKSAARAAQLIDQIDRGRIAFRRLELASERHDRATERAARAEEAPRSRPRRGGGVRRYG